MHFTISYGDHPTHHASQEKRDEFFRHERLDENLMEARFASEAAAADPGDITFNGAEAFDQIEKQVECFTGDGWNEGNVLSVQMYDQANQATFGYGSVGIFPDNGVFSTGGLYSPRYAINWWPGLLAKERRDFLELYKESVNMVNLGAGHMLRVDKRKSIQSVVRIDNGVIVS